MTTWDRTAVLSAVDSVEDGSVQGDALQQTNPSNTRTGSDEAGFDGRAPQDADGTTEER